MIIQRIERMLKDEIEQTNNDLRLEQLEKLLKETAGQIANKRFQERQKTFRALRGDN